MINNKHFIAVILGAGKSARMGFDKVTADLCGKPVFLYSVEAFINSGADEIIITVSEENLEKVKIAVADLEAAIPINVIAGGNDRVQSAVNAVNAISISDGIIAIHDCARPLVTEKIICKTAENAIKYKASIPAMPVKDTIKQCSNGFISSTPDRSTLYLAQTPQIFDIQLYKAALKNATESSASFTDDASMCELMGTDVHITEGDYKNIKLTTKEDLHIAEIFIQK